MPESKIGISKLKIAGLILLSVSAYLFLAYNSPRYLAFQVQLTFLILFISYLLLYKQLDSYPRLGIIISISFRLILLFSIPSLSDDFNRFIWDGRLLAAGVNPFHHVPEFYLDQIGSIPGITSELFNNLNFKIYHTMYPPVAQFTGWVAALIGNDSILWTVVAMRLFVIAAEAGSIWLIYELLKVYGYNPSRVLIYALNPLVILELTGNLHHEAFVIFFLLLTVYLFEKRNYNLSACAIAFAIASKLLPVIFLPLYVSRLGLKKSIWYYIIVSGVTAILFLPFIDYALVHAMADSGWLYFQKFEFNASVYYLVREAGFWVKGYNIIQTAGRWLAAVTFISIIGFSWLESKRKTSLPVAFMWVLSIYLAFTTTLHPWYILPVVTFSIFTQYRYSIAWSYVIFFSYAGYTQQGYEVPMKLIILEYLVVYGIMIYELIRNTDNLKHGSLNFLKGNFKA